MRSIAVLVGVTFGCGLAAIGGCKGGAEPGGAGSAAVAASGAAAASGSAAAAAADPKRAEQQKLQGAIPCINTTASDVARFESFYYKNIDPKIGPVPKTNVFLNKIRSEVCTTAAQKAAAVTPAVPELDPVIAGYAAALTKHMPLLTEAADYYEQKRQLDDNLAKGIEMHPKILVALDELIAAEQAMRGVVEGISRRAREAENAELGKDPARRVDFVRGTLMLLAEDLVKLGGSRDLAKIDAAAFQAKLDGFDKATADVVALAKHDSDHGFTNATKELLKEGLALARRLREGKGYTESEARDLAGGRTDIDGTGPSLVEQYNDLIEASNGISR